MFRRIKMTYEILPVSPFHPCLTDWETETQGKEIY
jgi:hypothetical protein